ncbi:hypothetical protein Tco_0804868 [Tanacetum coccineum]
MLDMIPNGVYRAELEVETIINRMREGQLRWFGHVRDRRTKSQQLGVGELWLSMELGGRGSIRHEARIFVFDEQVNKEKVQAFLDTNQFVKPNVSVLNAFKRLVSRAKVIENQSKSYSEDSMVTYTEVSSPFKDLSDIGSPGVVGPEYEGLPWMLDDPYVQVVLQAPPSPDYVPALRSQSRTPMPD